LTVGRRFLGLEERFYSEGGVLEVYFVLLNIRDCLNPKLPYVGPSWTREDIERTIERARRVGLTEIRPIGRDLVIEIVEYTKKEEQPPSKHL